MSRSIWKLGYQHPSLLKLASKNIKNKKGNIKIWDRATVITSDLINTNIEIYNGQKFLPLLVAPEMVGYKFGEFAFTRKRCIHKKKNKKK